MNENIHLGRYQIEAALGSGAYADVYRAQDTALKRIVALKVLKPVLLADREAFDRFVQEAQVTSGLFHPHIATVFDLGEVDGRYFIAMRYVDGPSLDKVLKERGPLPWEEALQITEQMAGALDFAHSKGLVHRDVKPQNILLSQSEGAVLTDFGLVKALQRSGLGTRTGAILGTPQYIPPEVWRGEPVGPPADQYALACIFVEMLTGKVLFDAPTPWGVIAKHYEQLQIPNITSSSAPSKVTGVLLKALAKDPNERFSSLREFTRALTEAGVNIEDSKQQSEEKKETNQQVETLEPGEIIQDQPSLIKTGQLVDDDQQSKERPTMVEKIKQNQPRLAVWGIVSLLLVIIVLGGFAIIRGLNPGFLSTPQAVTGIIQPSVTAVISASSPTSTGVSGITTGADTPTPYQVSSQENDLPTMGLSSPTSIPVTPAGNVGQPFRSVISPDNAGQVALQAWLGEGIITKSRLSIDGRTLAVASPRGVGLYDAESLAGIRFVDAGEGILSIAISPDVAILAVGYIGGPIRLWQISDGSLLRSMEEHGGGVGDLDFSPDGSLLVSAGWDATVRLWEVETGALLQTMPGHTDGVLSAAFSPDNELIASGSDDNTIRVWRVSNRELLKTLKGHTGGITTLSFSPDGTKLASGSWDRTVRLWDVAKGSLLHDLREHEGWIFSVSFSTDGETLASGSEDKTIRLWRVADGALLRTLRGHAARVASVNFSPGGNTLLSSSWDGTVRKWRVTDGSLLQTLSDHNGGFESVAFSTDGSILAAGSWDSRIYLWNVSEGELQGTLEGHTRVVESVAFSPDGTLLASGSDDRTIRLWRVSDGALIGVLEGHTSVVEAVAFSPDGKYLVSGSDDKTVRLWRVADRTPLRTLEGHTDVVMSVVFTTDGTAIASGSWDGTVRLWQVSDGAQIGVLTGHSDVVQSVTFSPDGVYLATGSNDKTIRLWRLSDLVHLLTIEGHSAGVLSLAFSPDSTLLASGSADGTVRLWNVASGAPLQKLNERSNIVAGVAFSPDGTVIASAGWDGTIRLWGVP